MKRTPKIWRDDDIAVDTTGRRLRQLLEVDDQFQRYGAPHTVAVIVEDIWRNKEVVDAILRRGMIPQLHGWNHDNLVECREARAKLAKAVRVMTDLFGRPPTVLYPPWNQSDKLVRLAARSLGLIVETTKVSLNQYVRVMGWIGESTINFHFWAGEDRQRLPEALSVYAHGGVMKVTDYAPRAAAFDTYLMHREGLVGAEIGVDVGAHAEALLRYCPVARLTLIDPWTRDYAYGYCDGRLARFRHRITMVRKKSSEAVGMFEDESFDFLYFDHVQEGSSVAFDLKHWWPKLRPGGVLGHRNYAPVNQGLMDSVDAFVKSMGSVVERHVEYGNEIVLIKLA